jgi:MFS family permease
VILVALLTVLLHFFHSCKYIYDYRINYQIIEPQRYGTMVFLSSAFTGIGGVAFSWLFSYMIDHNTGGNPYFLFMALTVVLLLATALINTGLKPIYPLSAAKVKRKNPIQQLQEIFHEESFRKLLIPNLLRGITLSVTGCIVLIAAVMGLDESGRAKIPLVTALATALASVVYMLLAKKLSVGAINIVGGVLTCALIFLPWNHTWGFLIVMFFGFLGRIIVDNAVPTMLFPIINPKIAGSYNAWRCVLYSACSIIITPVISALVDIVHPLWLLIPGTVTYLGVTIWYYLVCQHLKKATITQ